MNVFGIFNLNYAEIPGSLQKEIFWIMQNHLSKLDQEYNEGLFPGGFYDFKHYMLKAEYEAEMKYVSH